MLGWCLLRPCGPAATAVRAAVMVPHSRPLPCYLHIDGLGVASVGAQVAATVLQLLQALDVVRPARRGDGADAERQWHLLREVVQQSVEALEAAVVDGHAHAAKLRVAALEEGDSLGWGSTSQVGGETRYEGRRLLRVILKRGARVRVTRGSTVHSAHSPHTG